jgi:hypothetical protein
MDWKLSDLIATVLSVKNLYCTVVFWAGLVWCIHYDSGGGQDTRHWLAPAGRPTVSPGLPNLPRTTNGETYDRNDYFSNLWSFRLKYEKKTKTSEAEIGNRPIKMKCFIRPLNLLFSTLLWNSIVKSKK